MEFGIFDHLDRQDQPLSRTYEERLRLLEVADAGGIYGYHLAEHHATPASTAPSPGIFLAAAAQRTSHIKLGSLVYLLPLYSPLRLIQEVCMLDHLSGGRFQLGVGRGVSPIELGFYGLTSDEARERFDESLEVLLEGLTHDELTFHGKHYDYDNVPMQMRPLQQPHPPVWYPTHNEESLPRIAHRGFNTIVAGPAEQVKHCTESYWQNIEKPETSPLKIGVVRNIFVADSDAEAWDIARPEFRRHYESLIHLPRERGAPLPAFPPTLDAAYEDGLAYIGTPATVAEQLEELFEAVPCNYVIFWAAFGNLSFERASHSLGLFVNEVLPKFS